MRKILVFVLLIAVLFSCAAHAEDNWDYVETVMEVSSGVYNCVDDTNAFAQTIVPLLEIQNEFGSTDKKQDSLSVIYIKSDTNELKTYIAYTNSNHYNNYLVCEFVPVQLGASLAMILEKIDLNIFSVTTCIDTEVEQQFYMYGLSKHTTDLINQSSKVMVCDSPALLLFLCGYNMHMLK